MSRMNSLIPVDSRNITVIKELSCFSKFYTPCFEFRDQVKKQIFDSDNRNISRLTQMPEMFRGDEGYILA
jgi:hypothetical protein